MMNSNKKLIYFRELIKHEIASANVVVIPCGNIEKAEHLLASKKNVNPRKILIHLGKNDIDSQYTEFIAFSLFNLAEKYRKRFHCNVSVFDITPRIDQYQGHVHTANQMLS